MPAKLCLLGYKLNQKAGKEPDFRFYTLMDRIYREDTLLTAHKKVKPNKGARGVDGADWCESECAPTALSDSLQESRMREDRTSGLTRGGGRSLTGYVDIEAHSRETRKPTMPKPTASYSRPHSTGSSM